MSDSITLTVEPRETLGKKVKTIRQQGLVPAVVYNFGKESSHVQAEYQTIAKVVKHAGRHHPVELTLQGKKSIVMIRKIDRNPRTALITHVVLESVKANEVVETAVPVRAVFDGENNQSPAERAGLIVLAQASEIVIKAFPRNLPDEVTYNGEKLIAVGDQITAGDVLLPKDVELVTDPEHVVATVFEPSALAAANDDAGGDATEETTVIAENGSDDAAAASATESGSKDGKE
ncbi:MAG: 50S ribosomal protein L25 [Candidatus Saccharimonadales bacterium]